MAKGPSRKYWLLGGFLVLVGLLGLALWLVSGPSQELRDAENQAGALYDQGRYEEALPFAMKAVRLGEQEFGANHQYYGTLINDLALLYYFQSRYAEAEPLYERAVAIDEEALGPDHPRLATTLDNLALLYTKQSRFAEAEPL